MTQREAEKSVTCQTWEMDGIWHAHCPELDVTTAAEDPTTALTLLAKSCQDHVNANPWLFGQIAARRTSTFLVGAPR